MHRFLFSTCAAWLLLAAGVCAAAAGGPSGDAETDLGDAPDGTVFRRYPTLLVNSGAVHTIVPGIHLGAAVDHDADGQPSALANGDDADADGDDEDGVVFPQPLKRHAAAAVEVIAASEGYLQAWIDFDADGAWQSPAEQVARDQWLTAGTNVVSVSVPLKAALGPTYARFRFSTATNLPSDGPAPDGEVEDYPVHIFQEDRDYGDAPDDLAGVRYPTLSFNNGAAHVPMPGVHLGSALDAEPDGQPSEDADGDDVNGDDDEDGVEFLAGPRLAADAVVRVTASTGGYLQAWLDLDASPGWSGEGEQVLTNAAVTAGVNVVSFWVPRWARPGPSYARFRFATEPDLPFDGEAADGEVEDYTVLILPPLMDFGDALAGEIDVYPTQLYQDGARHEILPGIQMGRGADAEPDGQPTENADGDDTDADGDDEDGIVFVGLIIPGQGAGVDVDVSTNGYLQAWFDWNGDGDWTDADEQVFSNAFITAGINSLYCDVPPGSVPGSTGVRFRFSTQPDLAVTGAAPDGEVEDYQVQVTGLDFGDAPDAQSEPRYPTLLIHTGASHIVTPGVQLGAFVDADLDGQPTEAADGDDRDAGGNDDDGVVFLTGLVPGQKARIEVRASTNGYLQGWIDFAGRGDWSDPAGRIIQDAEVTGARQFSFIVPEDSILGATYARFRFSTAPGLGPDGGPAPDGEVEDYRICLGTLDFGDAPAGIGRAYPTLTVQNGARHVVVPGVALGAAVDEDVDGQPSLGADADDLDADGDDEDGVVPLTVFYPGRTAVLEVSATTNGLLQGWIDFDQDSRWSAPAEQVFRDVPLSAGRARLALAVPREAEAGPTYARFRFGTEAGLGVGGASADGEVEDYRLEIMRSWRGSGIPFYAIWHQPPDGGVGVDIQAWAYRVGPEWRRVIRAADDWRSAGQPVRAIRWWGSHIGWRGQPAAFPGAYRPSAFRLTLYGNSPPGGGRDYAIPGSVITNAILPLLPYGTPAEMPGEVSEFYRCTSDLPFSKPGDFEHEYDYYAELPVPWAAGEGIVYWLGVEALYSGLPTTYRWGWLSAPPASNWNAAAALNTSAESWKAMKYLPDVYPWRGVTNHPYGGEPLNLAFQLYSDDWTELSALGTQAPDWSQGEDQWSWHAYGPHAPDVLPVRADDFVGDGRRIADVRWWGSYRRWMSGEAGGPGNPVPAPTGAAGPLGFVVTWHADSLAGFTPGLAVAEVFAPIELCSERYAGTVTQSWLGADHYEHEYEYAVNLLDPQFYAGAWLTDTDAPYWVSIRAVFANAFEPGLGPHGGWGWLSTSSTQHRASCVSWDEGANWEEAVRAAPHPDEGRPFDLAFRVRTVDPQWTLWPEPLRITQVERDAGGSYRLGSTGLGGPGSQALQYSTNLSAGRWVDAEVNPYPLPWPQLNTWLHGDRGLTNVFFRVIQR